MTGQQHNKSNLYNFDGSNRMAVWQSGLSFVVHGRVEGRVHQYCCYYSICEAEWSSVYNFTYIEN